jgi:hypothetical protein
MRRTPKPRRDVGAEAHDVSNETRFFNTQKRFRMLGVAHCTSSDASTPEGG